jgi:hypothetical protein
MLLSASEAATHRDLSLRMTGSGSLPEIIHPEMQAKNPKNRLDNKFVFGHKRGKPQKRRHVAI